MDWFAGVKLFHAFLGRWFRGRVFIVVIAGLWEVRFVVFFDIAA